MSAGARDGNAFVLTLYYPGRQNSLRARLSHEHSCALRHEGHGCLASCLTTALVKHGAWNLRLLQQDIATANVPTPKGTTSGAHSNNVNRDYSSGGTGAEDA